MVLWWKYSGNILHAVVDVWLEGKKSWTKRNLVKYQWIACCNEDLSRFPLQYCCWWNGTRFHDWHCWYALYKALWWSPWSTQTNHIGSHCQWWTDNVRFIKVTFLLCFVLLFSVNKKVLNQAVGKINSISPHHQFKHYKWDHNRFLETRRNLFCSFSYSVSRFRQFGVIDVYLDYNELHPERGIVTKFTAQVLSIECVCMDEFIIHSGNYLQHYTSNNSQASRRYGNHNDLWIPAVPSPIYYSEQRPFASMATSRERSSRCATLVLSDLPDIQYKLSSQVNVMPYCQEVHQKTMMESRVLHQ